MLFYIHINLLYALLCYFIYILIYYMHYYVILYKCYFTICTIMLSYINMNLLYAFINLIFDNNNFTSKQVSYIKQKITNYIFIYETTKFRLIYFWHFTVPQILNITSRHASLTRSRPSFTKPH